MKQIFIIVFILFFCGCDTDLELPAPPTAINVEGRRVNQRYTIMVYYIPADGATDYDLFIGKPEKDLEYYCTVSAIYPYTISLEAISSDGERNTFFSAPGTYSFAIRSRNHKGVSKFSDTKTISVPE